MSQAAAPSFRFPEQRQQLGRAISDPQVLKQALEREMSPQQQDDTRGASPQMATQVSSQTPLVAEY